MTSDSSTRVSPAADSDSQQNSPGPNECPGAQTEPAPELVDEMTWSISSASSGDGSVTAISPAKPCSGLTSAPRRGGAEISESSTMAQSMQRLEP